MRLAATRTNRRGLSGLWGRFRHRVREDWADRRRRRLIESQGCFQVEQLEPRLLLSALIDDGDLGFAVPVGQWESQEIFAPELAYGQDIQASSSDDAEATWSFDGLEPDREYDVFVTWLARSGNTAYANYAVTGGAINPSKAVNQQLQPLDEFSLGPLGYLDSILWERIGTAKTTSGSTQLVVQLTKSQNGDDLVADAVTLVPHLGGIIMADASGNPVVSSDNVNPDFRKAFIQLNADHDEGNVDARGQPRADNEPRYDPDEDQNIQWITHGSAHDETVDGTIELEYSDPTGSSAAASWSLEFSEKVMVWAESATDPRGYVPLVSGENHQFSSSEDLAIIVEGVAASPLLFDAGVVLSVWEAGAEPDEVYPASVANIDLTIVGVDLDIDSDNDDWLTKPEFDRTEDSLEETEPGKIVYLEPDDSRTPVELRFILPAELGSDPWDENNFHVGPQIWFNWESEDTDTAEEFYVQYWDATTQEWTDIKRASARVSFGDPTGTSDFQLQTYTFSELGVPGSLALELSIDAEDSSKDGDGNLVALGIDVWVDPDGYGGVPTLPGYYATDSVLTTIKDGPAPPAIEGIKFNDVNGDGIRNTEPLFPTGTSSAVFVVDVSGSTSLPYRGYEPVGDPNSDGLSNTVLDAEIQALINLNHYLEVNSADYPDVEIAIVAFATGARPIDFGVSGAISQYFSSPGTAVTEALAGLTGGGGTNYAASLQSTFELLTQAMPEDGESTVVFLSDGYPNYGGDYRDEVLAIRGTFDTMLHAFGAGEGANLANLLPIDPCGGPGVVDRLCDSTRPRWLRIDRVRDSPAPDVGAWDCKTFRCT